MITIMEKLSYCLSCAGTGKRGNLNGKKICLSCDGTGTREIKFPETNWTTVDSQK